MERIDIAPDLTFSRLVYGMWRLADGQDTSPSAVQAKVEACLAQGITTIDHADIYGGYTVEGLFGNMLRTAPSLRDKIEIVTKCDIVAPVGRYASARVKYYDTTAAHIQASVDTSLRELATDRIDLLLVHRPDPLMNPDETGAALDGLVKSGKVKSVGVSNFRPWDFSLLQCSMEEQLVTNQIEISLTVPDAFTNGDLAFLQERLIAPMAWSPLGGGSLFNATRAPLRAALKRIGAEQGVGENAVAIAWLLRHPARIIPVLGTNNLDRIARIGDAASVEMDRQTWFELYTLAIGKEVP